MFVQVDVPGWPSVQYNAIFAMVRPRSRRNNLVTRTSAILSAPFHFSHSDIPSLIHIYHITLVREIMFRDNLFQ